MHAFTSSPQCCFWNWGNIYDFVLVRYDLVAYLNYFTISQHLVRLALLHWLLEVNLSSNSMLSNYYCRRYPRKCCLLGARDIYGVFICWLSLWWLFCKGNRAVYCILHRSSLFMHSLNMGCFRRQKKDAVKLGWEPREYVRGL